MERTVERALADIGPLVDSMEIVIVDDGSTDRTPELADALAAAHPGVRVVHQENRGYGGALRTGFASSRGRLISFSDGDLQFDLTEMGHLLARLDDPPPEAGRRGDRLSDQAPRPRPSDLHRQDVQRDRVRPLRSARARHRLRHEAVPARGLRRPATRRRLSVPVGRAAHQAPRARRTDRAGRGQPLSTNGGHEHGRLVPEDPPHVPRHREAARCAVAASARGPWTDAPGRRRPAACHGSS